MVLKKYIFPLVTALAIYVLYLVNQELGRRAYEVTTSSLMEMIGVIPPVFILLGLLDVWIPKKIMMKYLGEHSGFKGVVISFLMGSAAAGPLYGAFPIASILMKKGAKFTNVLVFIGAWSTTKIPMFLFELKALGVRFALTRLVVDIFGIVIIAHVINKLVSKEAVEKIYNKNIDCCED